MTRKLMIAVFVLGLACAGAVADEGRGLLVGVGAGYFNTELDVSTENFKDNTTAWKVFVGYRTMKFFSLEASYLDLGSFSDEQNSNELEFSTTGWDMELVGTLPLGSIFEIYGKAGYLWWDVNSDTTGLSGESGSDWVYGAGAKLIVAKKIGIRLEYEKFNLSADEADVNNVYLISAGVEWRF